MINSYRFTEKTSTYKEALEATETISPPAKGFIDPISIKQSLELSRENIKQTNTIIQLLVSISEEQNDIKTRLTSLEAELKTVKKATSLPTDISQSIHKLSEKLEKTHIGEPITRRVTQKGSFFVFKDPYSILEDERRKVKRS